MLLTNVNGSAVEVMTIGIVSLACFNAAGVPRVMIRSLKGSDVVSSAPMRRTRSACCAPAASGHAAAAPPSSDMNWRRLRSSMGSPSDPPGQLSAGSGCTGSARRSFGADLNRWQGARPGLGESLADRSGNSAVAEPSHVRRLACEHAGLSGRGRSRVTCNGGGPISDRGPPFQLTLHVTAGHRSAGTARRSSVLEASDLSVEQVRFPVLFLQNMERDLLGDENRRDLRRFPAGGWLHNSAYFALRHHWYFATLTSAYGCPKNRTQLCKVPVSQHV